MKKFKTKSGVIYAPKSEAVEAMMLKDPKLTVVAEKKAAKKPATKKDEAPDTTEDDAESKPAEAE